MFDNVKKGDDVIYKTSLFGIDVYQLKKIVDVTKRFVVVEVSLKTNMAFMKLSGLNRHGFLCKAEIMEYCPAYDNLIDNSKLIIDFYNMKSYIMDHVRKMCIIGDSQRLNDVDYRHVDDFNNILTYLS